MKVVLFSRAVKVPWSPASQTVKGMIRKKSHLPLHPLPTPVQGWVASAAMPEGVSCLRPLYERGAFYFLGAFLFSPAACSGLPLPPLRGPPPPSARVGKFRVEAQSPLLANSEQHVYGGKSHPALHPLPTPVQGWVASAYILSYAPLLVRWQGNWIRRVDRRLRIQ